MTIPGLSFQCFLKKTGVEIELLYDSSQYKLMEKGLRGGLTYIANRCEEADDSQDICYLDVSRLMFKSFQ